VHEVYWFADTGLDKFYRGGLKYVDWQINRASRKWNWKYSWPSQEYLSSADRFLLITTWLKNWKHLMRLLECDFITLDVTNWLREIWKVCTLIEFRYSTWLPSHYGTRRICPTEVMIRRVREYTCSRCSKTCMYWNEHCSVQRLCWIRISTDK
jgi:hypothetical protein